IEKDHQRCVAAPQVLEPLDPIGSFNHRILFLLEPGAEQVAHRSTIIHDEHGWLGHGRSFLGNDALSEPPLSDCPRYAESCAFITRSRRVTSMGPRSPSAMPIPVQPTRAWVVSGLVMVV